MFDAISADPKTWASWFPAFSDGGYETAPGLGARRWVRVAGLTYRETIVAWDEPSRWSYRVDESTLPMADALVEEWTMEPRGEATLVRWTFAVDPRAFFKVSGPLAPAAMRRLFMRAMRNLERKLAS